MSLTDQELHDLVRQILDQRSAAGEQDAAETQVQKRSKLPGGLLGLIDHTLLKPTATREHIVRLCAEALEYGFAAVCVNPVWVPLCAGRLTGSAVSVATVLGFPLGATLPAVKAFEAERCVAEGAHELDMVINIGALKSGEYVTVEDDIAAVAAVARPSQAILKVIIETAYLSTEEKVAACVLARHAGADYVKTSTGFGPSGATVDDVALMRLAVGPDIGVKAAGGIRTLADARAMVAAGATRLGASAGVQIAQELSQEAGSNVTA